MRVTMTSSAARTGRANEDFTGAVPTAAVLIDGAGIPGTESICRHGVAWYAGRLGGGLLGLLSLGRDRSLPALLAEAITRVTDDHRDTCDVADPISPSATVAILRLSGGLIEYLVLGDSVLVLDRADAAPLVVADPREVIISRSYQSALEAVAEGSDEYHRILRELRANRNRPGGFWVAKDDPGAADEAITGRSPIAGLTGAVLLSNGASRFVDRFRLADWPGVMAVLASSGPAEIIHRVRRAEARHAVPADDATIAHCTDLGVAPLIYGSPVIPRNVKILDGIRAEALERDIPAADVERWMGLARPCALLTTGGDGPVVGLFGGPVMLPADAADPRFPLLVTIDCAALPADVTDLPLPSDGRLLLFGFPESEGDYHSMGDVVYVPAGAAVGERAKYPPDYPPDYSSYAGVYRELPEGELHLTPDISLPFAGTVELSGPPWSAPLPGHPHSEELAEVWADQWGGAPLLVGGYGTDFNGGSPLEAATQFAIEAEQAGERPGPGKTSPSADDWVLLAECNVSRPGGGAAVFWAIQRDDLIARRFDRAHVVVDWNP
jgi:hypothetical protein